MANVTDPLIANVHGTDPQNLMDYIVRQKIYDTRYWKEECFGLNLVGVLEKASKQIKCIGGTYGPNNKPTKFICLLLKLLQIGHTTTTTDDGGEENNEDSTDLINDVFIGNDTNEFKYVRALGLLYKRMTGRPAEIYEQLEPLYRDYCKLRLRNSTDVSIMYMDEFIHSLLNDEIVLGIALPRLPKRSVLVDSGYLDEPYEDEEKLSKIISRPTALSDVLLSTSSTTKADGDDGDGCLIKQYLLQKVSQGSVEAKTLLEERQRQQEPNDDNNNEELSFYNSKNYADDDNGETSHYYGPQSSSSSSSLHDANDDKRASNDSVVDNNDDEKKDNEKEEGEEEEDDNDDEKKKKSKKDSADTKKKQQRYYGGLFKDEKKKKKSSSNSKSNNAAYNDDDNNGDDDGDNNTENTTTTAIIAPTTTNTTSNNNDNINNNNNNNNNDNKKFEEGSKEYWNEQRAKLGLKPLK